MKPNIERKNFEAFGQCFDLARVRQTGAKWGHAGCAEIATKQF